MTNSHHRESLFGFFHPSLVSNRISTSTLVRWTQACISLVHEVHCLLALPEQLHTTRKATAIFSCQALLEDKVPAEVSLSLSVSHRINSPQPSSLLVMPLAQAKCSYKVNGIGLDPPPPSPRRWARLQCDG